MGINRTALRIGLWLGLAEVIYGTFFRVVGFHHQSAWGWVFYGMLPAAVWIAQSRYCRQGFGLPYLQGVRLGAQTTAIGAAIYCLQVWAYNRLVDDSLLREVRVTQIEQLRAAAADAATIEATTTRLDVLLQPLAFAAAVWVQLAVAGTGAAIVLAAFARRNAAS